MAWLPLLDRSYTADVKNSRYDPGNERRVEFGDKVTVQTLNTRGKNFMLEAPSLPANA